VLGLSRTRGCDLGLAIAEDFSREPAGGEPAAEIVLEPSKPFAVNVLIPASVHE